VRAAVDLPARTAGRARERAAGALARTDGFAVRFPLEPIICAAK
jgi:hypothetical protein